MTLSRVVWFVLFLATLPQTVPLAAQQARWEKLKAQVEELYTQGNYAHATPIAAEDLRVA